MSPNLMRRLAGLLRAESGPLTDQLDRTSCSHVAAQVPERLVPDGVTRAVCGFCSTGCSLDLHIKAGRAVNTTPSPGYPVNDGTACPKGWSALGPLAATDRATVPLGRNSRGALVPLSWDDAIARFVGRVRDVQRRHGPESFAFLSSGQITTEEIAYLGMLAKLGMGVVHADANTRQCMATAVTAYKETFGFDAPPYTYQDFEESDVIVLWGSNLCIAHPILWRRITRNRRNPVVVVVDPRATETAQAATWHVPLRPKSDLVLAYGVARVLRDQGWIDADYLAAHTAGWAEFAAHLEAYPLDRVAEETGLAAGDIVRLATLLHRADRASLWWTMGVNQSHEGVRTAQALIALALMTGNIGKPGTGANSITGQCNAMGSRLFSNTTGLFGGRDFANPEHRTEVAGLLGVDAGRIPTHAGMAYDRILEGVKKGTIHGLWVIGTNPAHSWIEQGGLDDVFERLELLVVQDMYATTETAQRAELVLPAAGWGEKDGTLINSERRIGRVRAVAPPPGEALPDLQIFQRIAAAWGDGVGEMMAPWSSPAAVFDIMRRLSAGRPCDFSGITDYALLDRAGGIQWPFPAGSDVAEIPGAQRRLFEDGRFFTADGRARFMWSDPTPMPEPTSKGYPFLLMTGRGSASQWHTETRTGKVDVLRQLAPDRVLVEINPDDARRLAIRAGERLKVTSRRGQIVATAYVTAKVRPGHVFVAMHDPTVNRLTFASFDPYSRQPSYKAAAVNLEHLEAWEA